MTRRCKTCGQMFVLNKTQRNECPKCIYAKRKALGQKYPDQWKIWYARNRETQKRKSMEYYYRHRDRMLAKRRDYLARNRAAINEYQRRYYRENRPAMIRRVAEWNRDNPTKKMSLMHAIGNAKNVLALLKTASILKTNGT